MRLVRYLCAVMLVLAVAPGNAGLMQRTALTKDYPTAKVISAAMPIAADEMPDCPACDPGDGNAAAVCAQACTGLAAVLPGAVFAPAAFVATDRSGYRRGRLAGTAAGPEPRPPKAFVLA